MYKYSDLSGETFGNWTVIKRDESSIGQKNSRWVCRCKCGTVKTLARQALVDGRSYSCGCSKKNEVHPNTTHGMARSRLHQIWCSIKCRCRHGYGKSNTYLKRHIGICDEWENSFINFYNWSVANGYADSLTIDRIDNDGDYSPDNCRWITIEEQQSNKSNTVFIEVDGKKRCLRSLCREMNFPYNTAYSRVTRLRKLNAPITFGVVFRPIEKRSE